jgi:hypothetical protein
VDFLVKIPFGEVRYSEFGCGENFCSEQPCGDEVVNYNAVNDRK